MFFSDSCRTSRRTSTRCFVWWQVSSVPIPLWVFSSCHSPQIPSSWITSHLVCDSQGFTSIHDMSTCSSRYYRRSVEIRWFPSCTCFNRYCRRRVRIRWHLSCTAQSDRWRSVVTRTLCDTHTWYGRRRRRGLSFLHDHEEDGLGHTGGSTDGEEKVTKGLKKQWFRFRFWASVFPTEDHSGARTTEAQTRFTTETEPYWVLKWFRWYRCVYWYWYVCTEL